MKRLVSVLLVLVLCCCAALTLADAPSKGTNNMNNVIIEGYDTPLAGDWIIYIRELDDPEVADIVVRFLPEIEKIQAAESVEAYFGEAFDLKTMLETDALNMNEVVLCFANPDYVYEGDMNVKFVFATPYEEGEKVELMFGVLSNDDTEITYTPLEGVGMEDGSVTCEMPYELFRHIADNTPVLLDVVSK